MQTQEMQHCHIKLLAVNMVNYSSWTNYTDILKWLYVRAMLKGYIRMRKAQKKQKRRICKERKEKKKEEWSDCVAT